jgi:hypothetical protein
MKKKEEKNVSDHVYMSDHRSCLQRVRDVIDLGLFVLDVMAPQPKQVGIDTNLPFPRL